jgi:hypothetical protein
MKQPMKEWQVIFCKMVENQIEEGIPETEALENAINIIRRTIKRYEEIYGNGKETK